MVIMEIDMCENLQLSSSGIFLQLFDTNIERVSQFWSTISFALTDFPELNPVSVIQYLLEVKFLFSFLTFLFLIIFLTDALR